MTELIRKHINDAKAKLTKQEYQVLYQESIQDPKAFWAKQAKKYLDWDRQWDDVLQGTFKEGNVQWFSGARLNVCYNCVDRHLDQRADQKAIIWEGDDPSESKTLTYQQLHEAICRFANGMKSLGVQKGDRVCLYLPMIPEAAIAMLACARIGAVHSVVFGGFSPQSLKSRINDAQCSLVITADFNRRGGKRSPLKQNVDSIIADCPTVKNVVVVKHVGDEIAWLEHDYWYHDLLANASVECPVEMMEANDPLFVLYTSGSTGKPKGILHGSAGYLLYSTITFQMAFNYQEGDIYWCTADVGWITGHSYIVYGPLASGATTLMFAGVPTYPSYARFWQVIDKHQVNIFYTAPTAIRALMRVGSGALKETKRTSLKILGTVGEPINPEAWLWYYKEVGGERCPVVDTWWQTETGGMMILPLPYATALKPGSATQPFLGVQTAIASNQGEILEGEATGNLLITHPWPGQMLTIYGDHKRFMETYFSRFPGYYCPEDAASRDANGYISIAGRTDDVINVSGHRLGTAEIESAIDAYDAVCESAVVGIDHEIKGQAIYAFVTLKEGISESLDLSAEIKKWVDEQISPIAKPDNIQWVEDLPKTRSGKIMRRILRKIVSNEFENLGDISTLSNPEVVEEIISVYKAHKEVGR